MKALRHPGNLIIIGFVLAALTLLGLVFASFRIEYDMAVEGDYYQLEHDFNNQLAAERSGYALGKEFNFMAQDNKLTLSIPRNLSAQLDKGKVVFYCLSNSKEDTEHRLVKNADGTYLFDRSTVAPGHNYIVKVSFTAGGKDYYREFKML